ncbi:hypothetical protein CPter291_1018 [Collimonas pratensis]|uniref:Uncharacterized protein n=1 Tax=Collimonas pratensis TaxID=279113 RepID=A0ABN4M6C4_9BURK|nr:hypothetical protein CPter291_1018 [Collimonas pratensis]
MFSFVFLCVFALFILGFKNRLSFIFKSLLTFTRQLSVIENYPNQ